MKHYNIIYHILFATILFYSCNDKQEVEEVRSEKSGGELIQSKIISYPKTFDPRKIEMDTEMATYTAVYQSLVKINPNSLEVEPAIAKSWEVKDNCKSYIFTIRDDVFFHDHAIFENGKGRKLTVEDVKFCFDRIADTIKPNPAYDLIKDKLVGMKSYHEQLLLGNNVVNEVSGVKIIGKDKIKIDLVKPYCSFIEFISRINFAIYPKEVIQNGTFNDNLLVGTGPFMFDDVDSSKLTFKRNSNYYIKDAKGYTLPYLDKVSFLYGSKVNGFSKKLNFFKANKIDIIDKVKGRHIDALMDSLSPDEYNYEAIEIFATRMLAFKQDSTSICRNKKLRKAIAKALDRELIVDSMINGENWYADYGMNISYCFYKDSIVSEEYDLNKARQYLTQSGYTKTDTLSFLLMNRDKLGLGLVNLLRKNLGLTIHVDTINDVSLFYENIYKGNYDLVINAWLLDFLSPESSLMAFYGKKSKTEEDYNTKNFMRFSNQKFDQYFEKALNEEDEVNRNKFFYEAEKIVMDEAACVPLYYFEYSSVISSRVKDYYLNSLGLVDYEYIYKTK